MSIVAAASAALSCSACVVRTAGTRTVHTAYVADGSPESMSCLDQCVATADEERGEETADIKRSQEQDKKLTRCVRKCPGVERRPNETCPDGSEASRCRDHPHQEAIREANPVGIVGVSLGAAALITLSVVCVVAGGCIDTR
jgi:hypothetical protein